jgi:hypothetical protein
MRLTFATPACRSPEAVAKPSPFDVLSDNGIGYLARWIFNQSGRRAVEQHTWDLTIFVPSDLDYAVGLVLIVVSSMRH